jgi:GH18 family chitinase
MSIKKRIYTQKRSILLGFLGLLLPMGTLANPAPVIAAYYPDWKIYNQRDPYTPSDLPAKKLTHLIYAFLGACGPIDSAPTNVRKLLKQQCANHPVGTAVILDDYAARQAPVDKKNPQMRGNFSQLKKLSEDYPHLTILPSFGGWTLSEPFHSIVIDSAHRQQFVDSAIELLKKYPFFDGIQIDWEYPGGGGLSGKGKNNIEQEQQGYHNLLKELRHALDQYGEITGRSFELTTAINANKAIEFNHPWKKTLPYVNYVYLMSYDYLGMWTSTVGHQANLHTTANTPEQVSVEHQVIQLNSLGIPNEKIVMGVPFYGRGWQGVNNFNAQKMENLTSEGGMGKGSSLDDPGYFTYRDIARFLLNNPKQGFEYHYDKKAEAAVLFNPEKREYISFDDTTSLKYKAKFVKEAKLAGVFAWEITGDHQDKLLNSLRKELILSE